jgi:hypothetical protein
MSASIAACRTSVNLVKGTPYVKAVDEPSPLAYFLPPETMDLEHLSRLQFALTIAFHYIFPPMSIGLGLIWIFRGKVRLDHHSYQEDAG